MIALTPNKSRLAAILFTVALFGAALALAVYPALGRLDRLEEEIATQKMFKERFLAQASRREGAAAALAKLEGDANLRARLLDAPNAALAAAAMQKDFSEIVTGQGGRTMRILVLPVEQLGDFERVGLRVIWTTNTEGLRDTLSMLEYQRTKYVIEDLKLSAVASTRRRPRGDWSDLLTVEMDLYGFRLL